MINCYSLNLLFLAVAFDALGEHEKTIEISRGLLAALDQADLTTQLKLKARQEAESRIKAASLKQLTAAAAAVAAAAYPDATADSHPADSPQWHLDGINQDYPALAGRKNTRKTIRIFIIEYIFVAACVRVNEDEEKGRYSTARQYLDVGTIVARERALASVPFPDKVRKESVFFYHLFGFKKFCSF
jgi:hypothetical protein